MFSSVLVGPEQAGTSDVVRYLAVSEDMVGPTPQGLDFWEYPLAALGLVVSPTLLGADDYLDYLLTFMGIATIADAACLTGVILNAPRGQLNLRGAWLWVVAPFGLGLIALTRLDIFVCAAAALGLSAVNRFGRPASAGVLLSLGAAIKIWPGLLLLASLQRARGHGRVLLGCLVTAVAVLTTAYATGVMYLTGSFLDHQQARGLQIESLLALPFLWAGRVGLVDYETKFQYGAREIIGPGTGTAAALSTPLMVAMLLALSLIATRPSVRSLPIQERITLTGTLAVFALVVSNKVFSGQYMLWLVVMVAALAGWSRLEAHVGVCLTVATMMTHAVFPLLYVPLTHGDLAPLLLLTARDVLVIYMMGRLLARLVRGSPTTSRIRSTPLERSVEPVR